MNDTYLRAPHRPAASADAHSPHAALLIDFDNVTMGIRSNLGQELRTLLDSDIIRGKVSVQRAYADWRRYPQYIASLSEASIDLIFAPAYGSTKKNATDIRLAIDALEIVFIRPEIGTFILLSGDSDFSSLVLKLKEYGKYVIGVGIQESSSDLLVQNCDEYYSYNSLSGLTSASDMKNIEKHDPWELAAKAIRRMKERGDVMRSDRFKQVMLELDPSFNEKSIGFSKFNRFLTESASRGILELKKASNGQYEVSVGPRLGQFTSGGGSEASSDSSPAPSRSAKETDSGRGRRRSRDDRGRGSGGRSRDRQQERPERSDGSSRASSSDDAPPAVDEDRLRAAYDLLQAVVADRAGEEGSVRDSEVKRQMVERDADFDEAALGFRKFSRFLRQAHDEEVINLERTPQGNYTVALVEGAATPSSGSAGEKSDRPAQERRRGRGRQDRKSESRGSRDPESRTEKEPEARTEQEADRGDDSTGDREAEAAPTAEARAESASSGPSRSPLAGRKRRSTPSHGAAKVVPGPVDSGKDGDSRPAEKQETKTAPPKPSTRTMGRFRRGSRGPGGPASPASGTGKVAQGAGASDPAADGSPADESDASDLVQRMARGYQGVGRRTAERLVDEFGDRVLEVIDHEPEKIEDVLPKGRAQAVIEGRKAELEGDSE